MRWVRHRLRKAQRTPVKGETGMDEVIKKKTSDKFFVNTVFGRESWSCKKIQ